MKKLFWGTAFFFTLLLSAAADSYHIGLEGATGVAIGTGKGYWDWMDAEQNIQRTVLPNAGVSLLFLADINPLFQLEGGAGFNMNRCLVKNGDFKYRYEQSTVDLPLSLRMFFNEDKRGFFVKGGGSLIFLMKDARFIDENSGRDYLASPEAENPLHAGLQLGLGWQKKRGQGLWQTELRYATFYSSPDYRRTDGSIGDIRFHRFQLAAARFF